MTVNYISASRALKVVKGLGTMPCLQKLSKEELLNVLEFSSDASVLELAATSRCVRSAVGEIRSGSGFPWQHPPGTLSGLWRFLGLGDLKRILIPSVSLQCDVEFQNFAEVVAFLKAANDFAADTMDGNVTFDKLSFDAGDVAHLFLGADDRNGRWCATGGTEVLFNGRPVACTIDAQRTDDDENPWMYVHVDCEDLPPNPIICCSSLLSPELRMRANIRCGDIHDLDEESPFTDFVLTSIPLPLFFGVKELDVPECWLFI